MTSDRKNVYGWSMDEENFIGDFETREEAILEGFRDSEGSDFLTAEAAYPDPALFVATANEIVEMAAEATYDSEYGGEWAEGWPEVSKEAEKELNEFLDSWIRKHAPTTWYSVLPGTIEKHKGRTDES